MTFLSFLCLCRSHNFLIHSNDAAVLSYRTENRADMQRKGDSETKPKDTVVEALACY